MGIIKKEKKEKSKENGRERKRNKKFYQEKKLQIARLVHLISIILDNLSFFFSP